MSEAEYADLMLRWVEAMRAYAKFLIQQQGQNAEMAATLTLLELPNLFSLLDAVQIARDAEATIDLATSLHSLLKVLGKPRLIARVGRVRDAAAAALGDAWSHARFEAARTRIEQQSAGGQLREASEGAKALLERARGAGELAYAGADYDVAGACFILAQVMNKAGDSEQALALLDEARLRFEAVGKAEPGRGAERMASVCLLEQGGCLLRLGRLDEAAAASEESIRRREQGGDERGVAVGKSQLGAIRLEQCRYPDALTAYAEARERFTALDEPGSVAVSWHQTGRVHQRAGQSEAAEAAYRQSLAINVDLDDALGQASTLNQLGTLYADALQRREEAVAFYRQAVDRFVQAQDLAGEGRTRNNLGDTLRQLRRLDEARHEIRRANECKSQFGHATEPWTSWSILAGIETDAGDPAAAAQANNQALASYLAYRQAGGENHFQEGRLAVAVTQSLRSGGPAEATLLLGQLAGEPKAAHLRPFSQAMQAIVAGSRDRSLANAPDIDYTMAAEILLLIDTLGQPQPQPQPQPQLQPQPQPQPPPPP